MNEQIPETFNATNLSEDNATESLHDTIETSESVDSDPNGMNYAAPNEPRFAALTIDDKEYSTEPLRPLVEWVYPSRPTTPTQADELNNNIEVEPGHSEGQPGDYEVDPHDVVVTLEVEGQVVKPRRYYMKICGFEVCRDSFVCLINPKLFPILIVVIVGLALALYFKQQQPTNISLIEEEVVTISPSASSLAPSYMPLDERSMNITELIRSVSGDVVLVEASSQSKALNWILNDDPMKLEYNSSNIIQRYVLMVLYYNLSGENWIRNGGFGTSEDECGWYGVECEFGFIVMILVENNNLRGQMPTEVGLLSHLSKLRIRDDSLTGTLPSEIGSLRSLQFMFLDANGLTGTIPTEIGKLKTLQSLILSRNKLTGTIPSELGQNSFLSFLHLHENKLTGTIPKTFETLLDVKEMLLFKNMLTGTIPSGLYRLHKLEIMLLRENQLTGTIPNFDSSSITSPRMLRIDLANTMLNGTIPESLNLYIGLETLKLHSTFLAGSVPDTICDLPRLRELSVDCAVEDPRVSCSCCTECF